MTRVVPTWKEAVDQLAACASTTDLRERAERLALDLEEQLAPYLADAATLQAVWVGQIARPELGPTAVLSRLALLVDRHFPPARLEGVTGPVAPSFPSIRRTEMPIRTAAYLFAARYAMVVIDRRRAAKILEGIAVTGAASVRSRPGPKKDSGTSSVPSAYDARLASAFET